MKVGNTINGLTITDVKQVNKLNLIQFLKEVDNYLQQGYRIDVNSARQVGLVLRADLYKTESTSSVKVGSVGEQISTESVASKEVEPITEHVVTESTVQQEQVNAESVEEVAKEDAPVAAKKTTTRSKKTVQ